MSILGLNPVVVLNGANITSDTIDEFSLDVGSQHFADQPQPSVLSLILLNWTVSGLTPLEALGKYLTLQLSDGAGLNHDLFTGIVNQSRIVPQGDGVYLYEITATSVMSKMMDTFVSGTYPAQTDEQRVSAIFGEAWSMAWDKMDTATTWDSFDDVYGDLTWDEFELVVDGYTPLISSGTTFNVIETAETDVAYSILYETVHAVRGRLIEDGTGLFYFFDRNTIAANLDAPLVTIDINDVVLDGSLSASIGLAELINTVTIESGALSSTQSAADSIKTYGIRPLEMASILATQNDLDTVAAEIVGTAAEPRPGVSTLAIPVCEGIITQGDWLAIEAALYGCQGVSLESVPDLFGGNQTVLINGASYEYYGGALTVNYNVQTKSQIMPYQMWDSVDGAVTWDTYLPNVAWDLAP